MKTLLKGTSQVLFVIAGLLFFAGGIVISALTKTDRLLSEMLGVGLAFVFVILGVVAKKAAEKSDDGDATTR